MSSPSTSTFDVIPAIDLRGGRVVRLEQGDFGRESVVADDPIAQALAFADAGATWIHVVDLDGARDGDRRQADVIGALADALAARPGVRLQVAGGLRDAAGIDEVIGTGAARVILGTAAVTQPEVVRLAVVRHGPDRVAVALDVRDGRAVGDGWVPGAPSRPVGGVLDDLADAGLSTVIVTAIARDGLLGGPDLQLLAECRARTTADVIASAGIRSIGDLEAVQRVGCRGAIVGRAIYDGRIHLGDAIRALGTGSA